ncbi:hypothetical protein Pla110_00680 [Polystyrenella longa]|uniref:Uncharacterized protein n=1 Tax=Polystyrenella longa TaxID=2528007 RepID=A0A518CGM6_9PLAN|nr:hypothetical protein [Polystyrenella longa]QDU78367.1 hypothetical protein Pla110_00680 [Polystyrenella longa]
MSDGLNDEILHELSSPIATGDISIFEEDLIYDAIKDNFPIGMGRIDWSKVKQHKYLNCSCNCDFDHSLPKEIGNFFLTFFRDFKIDENSTVYVMNDDAYSFAFRMPIRILMNVLHIILSYPQHTYIIPEDSHWCFQYTWEQDLYCGFAPKYSQEMLELKE